MANFNLRSSRDSGTSSRDEEVRRKNIREGRGNSTADRGGKAKPKAKPREEMSGKSDAPAKPKAAAPKKKKASPFKLPSKAPIPPSKPQSMAGTETAPPPLGMSMAGTETAPPQPAPYMYGIPPSNSMAGTETAPRPAPSFTPPFNPQMSDASILHTVPPDLRNVLAQAQAGVPGNTMAGQQTAPRPPLPTPFEQMSGPYQPAPAPAPAPLPGQPGYDGLSELRKIMGFG